jgi:hypothetical protein
MARRMGDVGKLIVYLQTFLEVLQRLCCLALKYGQAPKLVQRRPCCPRVSGLAPDLEAALIVLASLLVVALDLVGTTDKVQILPLVIRIAGRRCRLMHDTRALKAAGDVPNVPAEFAECNPGSYQLSLIPGLPGEIDRLAQIRLGLRARQLGDPASQLNQHGQPLGVGDRLCQPLLQFLNHHGPAISHRLTARLEQAHSGNPGNNSIHIKAGRTSAFIVKNISGPGWKSSGREWSSGQVAQWSSARKRNTG